MMREIYGIKYEMFNIKEAKRLRKCLCPSSMHIIFFFKKAKFLGPSSEFLTNIFYRQKTRSASLWSAIVRTEMRNEDTSCVVATCSTRGESSVSA